MNLNPKDLKFKKDYDTTKWLHLVHFICVLAAFFINWAYYENVGFLRFLLSALLLIGFYRYSYLTVKNLYYTFWTFSLFLLIFLLYKTTITFFSSQAPALFYLYGLAVTFLFIELYILSSPIYYPFVNWWEYDFRFRYDMKIKVKDNTDWEEVRLTDLRRGAACIASFDVYKHGQVIDLQIDCEARTLFFKAEVISKRQYSVGRPFHYGVRLKLGSDDLRKDYQAFSDFWSQRKTQKRKLKLEKVSAL